MRVGTFWYCLKEGIKNIGKNIWFSLASVAVVSACIFLFCIFFSLVALHGEKCGNYGGNHSFL